MHSRVLCRLVHFNMYVGFFYSECKSSLFNDIKPDIFYDSMQYLARKFI